MHINDQLSKLKGVGKKRIEKFIDENIFNIKDLLNFFPKKYENRSKIGYLNTLNQELTFEVKVLSKPKLKFINSKRSILIVEVKDRKDNKAELVFFNQPYLTSNFIIGKNYLVFGKVINKKSKNQIFSPKFSPIEKKDEFLKIIPNYKTIESIPQKLIQKSLEQILNEVEIPEFLPLKYRKKFDLISLKEMYNFIHFPKSNEDLEKALKRLKFNEALKINASIYTNKKDYESTDLVLTNFSSIKPFIKNLPFELTDSQNWVLRDIFRDLESGYLMNRMVEGDVGSGKTIIAIICAYLFSLNGLQTAYMAPTEVLAKQHYQTFLEFFKDTNLKIALLIGSQNNKENELIREKLSKGEIDIIIGTHALIQDNTQFYNLGLVITDEQHRFGVKQRGMLERKGRAHTLVMSATPIPRSLALTLYGDLDLSIIDQMPAGRKKVKTYFYTLKKLNKILKFIEEEVKKGHQAFIVCPFIEDNEELKNVISIEKAYNEINKKYGNRLQIEMLHSKMSTEQKEQIINDFNDNKINLLIATSIIEVGINVPNVSVIVILSADRFGLSQLHQLRGRTGRSDIQSYCFLLSNNQSEQTIERMKTIVNCHDGREIAQVDLEMRGPGEYFGFKQHGYNNIKFIDPIKDKEVFEITKSLINEIFNSPLGEDMICKDYLIKEFNSELEYITLN